MIDGVVVKPLKKICDDRGMILKMQQSTDKEFAGFGEMYFSTIYPKVVKGWHLHDTAILNYAAVEGMIKLVLYDNRQDSTTRGELMEIVMGEHNYVMVQIPPMVWNGFTCVGNKTAIVADLINIPHEQDIMHRLDPHNNDVIQYDWQVKNR